MGKSSQSVPGAIALDWSKIDYDNLPHEAVAAIYHTFESCRGGDSLLDFIPRTSPNLGGIPTLRPNHLKLVADAFAKAETQAMRICLSTPPRHSKTEIILHGIAWFLLRHPKRRVIYVSATAEFARMGAKKAMQYYKAAGGKVKRGSAQAAHWETTAGGSLYASGIKGQIVGRGADLFVVDDYIKSRLEAESPTHRQNAWDLFRGSVMTRVHPGGSVIVVQTRWHRDDIIGKLDRDFPNWTIINLPCYAEAVDPLGREPGELLWPEFWSKDGPDGLDIVRKAVGEFEWSAQYQGRPRPRGTELFREPTYINDLEMADDIKKSRGLIICDPAATSKNYSDFSAIVVGFGYVDPVSGLPIADIAEVYRVQVEVPALVHLLVELNKKWNAPIGIEAVGGFKAIPQMLRNVDRNLKVFEVPAVADKYTRSIPAAAAWNDGRIRLRANQSWNGPFVDEFQSFTGIGDDTDDQLDALAHFYNALSDMLPRPRNLLNRTGISPLTPFG